MKRIIAILTLLALLGTTQAQTGKMLFSQWKLKSAGISFGLEQDRIVGLGADRFLRMTGDQTLFEYLDVDPSELDRYGEVCENPHMRIQAVFQPQLMPNIEVHTSLVTVINRVDGMTYYSYDHLAAYNDYLTLTAWGHELAADMAVLRRVSYAGFSLYGGLGTNLGYTFGNELNVYGDIARRAETASFLNTGLSRISPSEVNEEREYLQESFNLRNGVSQRVYAQAGASITILKRLELGMEGRYGIGYRMHFNGQMIGTNLQSFGLFTRWNFQ
ncbi:MAG: hypothetical protein AAFY71_08975 [Bacteroidota bacterium]